MDKAKGNRYMLLLGKFHIDTMRKFSLMTNQTLENISPEKWHIGYFRSRWTRCQATLSRLCFCEKRLDQMILGVPFNLVFYNIIRLFNFLYNPKEKILSTDFQKNYWYISLEFLDHNNTLEQHYFRARVTYTKTTKTDQFL